MEETDTKADAPLGKYTVAATRGAGRVAMARWTSGDPARSEENVKVRVKPKQQVQKEVGTNHMQLYN